MSRLTPDKTRTVEITAGEWTPELIQRELERWTGNLKGARDRGDILGVTTALKFLDTWLDRKNAAA